MDIENSMNVVVNYASGTKMSYSLNAYMPWEGYTIAFNGSKGRLEHKSQESLYITGDSSTLGAMKKEGRPFISIPHFKPAYAVDVWTGKGGHAGGDARCWMRCLSRTRLKIVISARQIIVPGHIRFNRHCGQSVDGGCTLVHIADLVHGL